MLKQDYTARADEVLKKKMNKGGMRSNQHSAHTFNKKTAMDSHQNLRNMMNENTFDGMASLISGQGTPSMFSQNGLTMREGMPSQGSIGMPQN